MSRSSIFNWDSEWRQGRSDEDMGEAFTDNDLSLAERVIAEIEFARSSIEIQRLLDGNIRALTDDEYREAVEAGRLRVIWLNRSSPQPAGAK